MLKTIASFFWLLFFCFPHSSTCAEIKGQIVSTQGNLPKRVFIGSFLNQSKSDTIEVNMYGGFTYQLKEAIPTLYRIQAGKAGFTFFAMPNSETIRLKITTREGEVIAGETEDYRENDAFNSLSKMLATFDVAITQAIENKEPDSIFRFILRDYNRELRNFNTYYKGTYAGDSLVKMRYFDWSGMEAQKKYLPKYIDEFFSSINFYNTTLAATPILTNMIDFLSSALCINQSDAENKVLVSALMKRASVRKKNYQFVADRLFLSAISNGQDKMARIIIDWLKSEADSVSIPVLISKAERLSASMPGKTYEEVKVDSGMALSDVVSRNKYTLLIFWESGCTHCRSTLPVVKKVYDTFHQKGFDVFAVSTDEDLAAWKRYNDDLKYGWVNTNINDVNHPTLKHYYITQLPTLILINQSGFIEKRLADISAIGDYLLEKLN